MTDAALIAEIVKIVEGQKEFEEHQNNSRCVTSTVADCINLARTILDGVLRRYPRA